MAGSTIEQDRSIEEGIGDLKGLCRIGGFAAFIFIVYSLATMVQMGILGGQPATAAEAFSLLAHNKAVGLLRLDLPTAVAMPLYYLLFLGLYAALRHVNRAIALLSTALIFAGLTMLMATPGALSMLALSNKYAAATNDAARAQLLAAGEAAMAGDMWHGTGAILGGVLVQCGAVLICCVMLRGGIFSKATAWLGIVMHSLDLLHIVGGFFVPEAGVVLMAIAGPLYPFWLFLVGRRLLKLASLA
jgi:hypothetical protein